MTDGGGNIEPFFQYDKDFIWEDAAPVLSGSQSTSLDIDLASGTPLGLVTKAYLSIYLERLAAGGNMETCIRSLNQNNFVKYQDAYGNLIEDEIAVYTDESSKIRLELLDGSLFDSYFIVTGYNNFQLEG